MKIIVILYFNLKKTEFLGVQKKIFNQVSALRRLGHEVDLAYCKDSKFVIENLEGKVQMEIKRGLTHYRGSIQKALDKVIRNKVYDLAYVRFPGSIDLSILRTFKHLKRNGLNIVLEMPTYPVGGELMGRLNQLKEDKKLFELGFYSLVYTVHLVCSRQIYKYVDRIATYVPYDEIWKTKTIILDNGVNALECPPVRKISRNDDTIILLGVAVVSPWHGYDRVIEGLYEYYREEDNSQSVIFKIIGNSPLVLLLKEKVKEYGLEHQVEFYGALTGEKLYEEYCNADIGISSLGMHRINVLSGSPLKTKEYCSHGLPFIFGYQEKMIDENFPFALRIPADDSPLKIKDVICYYKKVREIPDYQIRMHEFAVRNYDWTAQMKRVLESIG